ncbi:hypothetical protein MNEG_8274 [Monoraphidium neglectum]|uniref:Uncharacterized protein n=1 Tax=Monoraphidium neglectum TaxID=145388 RepID=A0A0D2JKC2_9CHLO|nr:hypothetical protein MNEG_8274 [Monoraphidium neglectum]KIY99687.1 hypothetical protein MNEG_8274 [Monoraphidium neglectum]|eukprot:XP_013898707.1 hypothetical protein MNEG_8274 [Monoraphidium neglectum]
MRVVNALRATLLLHLQWGPLRQPQPQSQPQPRRQATVLLPLPPPPVPLARVPHSHQILSALRPLGVQDQINMAQINMARQRQAQEQLTQDARLAEQFRRAAQRQQHAAAGPDHFQAYAQGTTPLNALAWQRSGAQKSGSSSSSSSSSSTTTTTTTTTSSTTSSITNRSSSS